MAGLQERLDQMEIAIHAPAFRDGSGRANEVNYWVFDYNPANELEVRERIECMKKKNAKGMDGFRLAVFDLYDMIMDYLEEKDFVKFYERYETRRGFEYIVRAVSTSIYHLDPANLVFYLRNDDESEEEEQITSTRHEVRKKFWTSALDLIKEANAESGAFSNCNPVKDNWINGYFGIQGFHLCCVANYDSARVEVHFGKADNDENKKAYDLVATHRAEIEKALGEELIWDRGDDRKSSKIYFEIDGVGITNEADWPVIAKFHAKWSARLYKAIVVPYLKPVYSDTLVPVKSANMPTSKNTIEIKKIVITDLDTDAIVNAVNDGLWAGGGVCGAIFRAAGHEKLKAACNKIGHCDTGSAVIAPGFDLKAKYIIHAVGPV